MLFCSIAFPDSSLTISAVRARHAGMYQCIAASRAGMDYESFRLVVQPSTVPADGGLDEMQNNAPYSK